MDKNIEIIRSACHKANPSIKDLVFGCVVSYEQSGIKTRRRTILARLNGTKRGNSYLVWDYTPPHDAHSVDDGILKTCKKVWEKEIYENYGRDIRLADVLVAVKHKGLSFRDWKDAVADIVTNQDYMLHDNSYWNLLKDRLEDQSPECLEFIANLLK